MRKAFLLISIIMLPMFLSCGGGDDEYDGLVSGEGRCQEKTKEGNQCKRKADKGSIYCWQHKK